MQIRRVSQCPLFKMSSRPGRKKEGATCCHFSSFPPFPPLPFFSYFSRQQGGGGRGKKRQGCSFLPFLLGRYLSSIDDHEKEGEGEEEQAILIATPLHSAYLPTHSSRLMMMGRRREGGRRGGRFTLGAKEDGMKEQKSKGGEEVWEKKINTASWFEVEKREEVAAGCRAEGVYICHISLRLLSPHSPPLSASALKDFSQ